jgi:D-arabinose 1-dehydrogenase-like Zn-dependent alcohol dehydrogenase
VKTKKLVVFGYGARGVIYANYAKAFPEKFELVAIIENNQDRISFARESFPSVEIFSDYREFLKRNIEADIVAVATQDDDHREHAVAMMKAGYVTNAGLLYDEARELNFTMAYDNHIMSAGYSCVEERAEKYKAVTPERIRQVAELVFKPENLTLALKRKVEITPVDTNIVTASVERSLYSVAHFYGGESGDVGIV